MSKARHISAGRQRNGDIGFWLVFAALYIILNALSVAMLFTEYNLKNDEVGKYLLISKSIAYDGKIEGNSKTSEFYPGAISIALGINKAFGWNEPQQITLTIKVMHVLLVNLAFIFLFLLGRELFSREVGLLAASFLCFMSYWLTENRHFLMDTPATMLIIASAYFLFSGVRTDSASRLVASGIFLVFAFMAKFPSAIFGFSLLGVFITSRLRMRRKLMLTAIFLCSVGLMLLLYAALDYATKGSFAGSLLQTFKADFNPDIGGNLAPLYFVPLHFYLLSIMTFMYPLISFFGYGLYSLYRRDRLKLLHLSFFLVPLTLLLSVMTWKESRYIIPAIPFFIMIGAYGMHSFFRDIKPRKDYLKVAVMALSLLLLMFGIGWAKENIFVRMNYQVEVQEYGPLTVYLLSAFFIASIIASAVLAIQERIGSKDKIAFGLCSLILVIGVMPHAAVAESLGRDSAPSCATLITDNLDLIGDSKVSSATPCSVPKFYYRNASVRFTVPDARAMTEKKLSAMAGQIESTAFLVGNAKLESVFEQALAKRGKRLVCVAREGDFCIFSVNSLGFGKAAAITADSANLELVDVRRNYDNYFIYKEESRLVFRPDVMDGSFILMFKRKADGPPPLQAAVEVQAANMSQAYFYHVEQSAWGTEYMELGNLRSPIVIIWRFMNDTAAYDAQSGTWVDDRNLYVKDIVLLEVLQ